jgi:hypothetical protein
VRRIDSTHNFERLDKLRFLEDYGEIT